MKTKTPPCCSRLQARLGMDRSDLARIARAASARPEQRSRWADKIATAKKAIAETKQIITDHEASHAAEQESAA